MNSTELDKASVHYARCDTKKKGAKSKNGNSNEENEDYTSTTKKCYRCGKHFTEGHLKKGLAIETEYNFCKQIGHFEKCCNKKENFPKEDKKKVHSTSAYLNNRTLLL